MTLLHNLSNLTLLTVMVLLVLGLAYAAFEMWKGGDQ